MRMRLTFYGPNLSQFFYLTMTKPDEPRQLLNGAASSLDSLHQYTVAGTDLRVPLHNLSTVSARMDSVQRFLSDKVNTNTLIGDDQMSLVSSEIASAIHQVILNGAALLAYSQLPNTSFQPLQPVQKPPNSNSNSFENPNPNVPKSDLKSKEVALDLKLEETEDDVEDKWDIIELDAVELLAEHVHFCEICGKGFKRDANLRMHMRAHGNQFKTHEALLKPEKSTESTHRLTRFSCPFTGCNRNKHHKKFRPLKSVICVKNHFKRSHCPKMYSCNRCNKKSFSVVADLKSHMKHCGETKWKCSCGTSFSRKDKLFGHMALFEGHMPAIMEDEEENKEIAVMVEDDDHEEVKAAKETELEKNDGNDNGFFDGLFDGFDSIDNFCFQDVLGGSNSGSGAGNDWFL